MINAERIEEMKRLSAEATPGPWIRVGQLFKTHDDRKILGEAWRLTNGYNDPQFIAESRQFVPDIIAAYEVQAEEIAKLRKALAKEALAYDE